MKTVWFSKDRTLIAILLFLLGLEVCYATALRDFVMMHRDVIFYSEIARNLLEGKGFVTQMRFTYELPFIPRIGGALSFAFISPVATAQPFLFLIPFALTGANDFSIIWISSLIFILAALPLYFIGRRFFGAAAGFAACFLYFTDAWNVATGYAGFTQVPFTLLALWGCYFIFREGKRPTLDALTAGLLLGVALLFREEARLFLLSGILYLLFDRKGKEKIIHPALMLAVFCLFLIPKYLQEQKYFPSGGSPYFALNALNFVGPYKNWTVENLIEYPPVIETVRANLPDFIHRTFTYFFRAIKNILRFHPVQIASAFAGLMLAFRRKDLRPYLVFCVSLLLLHLGLYSFIFPLDRYTNAVVVAMLPLDAFALVSVVGRLYASRIVGRLALSALAGLVSLYLAHWIFEPQIVPERPVRNLEKRSDFLYEMSRIRRVVPEGEWIVTENAPLMTWYSRRPTLGLLLKTADYARFPELGVTKPYYIFLADWYLSRKDLFDPVYRKAYENDEPLLGAPHLLTVDIPVLHGKLFGPFSNAASGS